MRLMKTLFPYIEGAKLIVADIDGTLTEGSTTKKGFFPNFASFFDEVPIMKRIAFPLVETMEICFHVRHDKRRLLSLLKSDFQYKVIVTDRSYEGLHTVLGSLSKREQRLLLALSAIQVRSGGGNMLDSPIPIWESGVVKPHIDVFERVASFAREMGLRPQEVIVVDDSLKTRLIAKTHYNFRVYPDTTVDTDAEENAFAMGKFFESLPLASFS